jgi:hypothetical protein
MGTNPAASQGSLLAAPDVIGLIGAIRKRGKVIVIDPVRTATADRADEWLPITPGTDAALLLALAHTLFDEQLVDLGVVEPYLDGVDVVRDLTGHFDVPGGSMFPRPPAPGPFGDRYGEHPGGLTLEKLKAEPNGIDFGPIVREPDELVLVSRRHLRSNNSWLHNVGPLMKGRDRCTLLIHRDVGGRGDPGAGGAHRCDQTGGGGDAARLGDTADRAPGCPWPTTRPG